MQALLSTFGILDDTEKSELKIRKPLCFLLFSVASSSTPASSALLAASSYTAAAIARIGVNEGTTELSFDR